MARPILGDVAGNSGARGRVLSSSERGASLVEFAIIFPVFMIIVLGMFSGGVAYNRQIAIRNAAKEGARYGATVPRLTAFTSGTWATNVRDVVVERSEEELEGADVCVALVSGSPAVAVSSSHTTAGGTSPCFAESEDDGQRVQVRVTSTAKLEALVFSYDIGLDAEAVANHEGEA
jgi:Flp pilus assembly protein TadG